MPKFTVEARSAEGKKVRAKVEANSLDEAMGKMRSRGYEPLNATPVDADFGSEPADDPVEDTPAPAATGSAGPDASASRSIVAASGATKKAKRSGKVKSKILSQFTTQMAVLLDAGLPIVRSLKILENQAKPGPMKNALGQVADAVQTGSTFSDALSHHPGVFDRLYVNMIRAGEAGGVLDTILKRLAEYLEKAQALKRKVISASLYPAGVILFTVAILVLLMIAVVPKFVAIFDDFGQELPLVTEILINSSNVMLNYWYLIMLAPIVFAIAFKFWGATKSGRVMLDRIKLKIPLFGSIMRKAVIARFCRTLGTLIQSGVPILDALTIVKGASGNEIVSRAIQKVYESIREGDTVAQPLSESGIFDDLVINMIAVGEETGELDKMLMKIADQYDGEVDDAVGGLMSIMEPLMIIFLGITIGFIVVALFLPLVSIMQNLGG